MSADQQIRANFDRLKSAVRDRDAKTVCELLFPFGEHQPRGALAAQLARLESTSARSHYAASIAQCAPGFARDPRNFTAYEAEYGRATIRSVCVRGNIARVDLTGGTIARLTFVDAAGEWRILVGAQ